MPSLSLHSTQMFSELYSAQEDNTHLPWGFKKQPFRQSVHITWPSTTSHSQQSAMASLQYSQVTLEGSASSLRYWVQSQVQQRSPQQFSSSTRLLQHFKATNSLKKSHTPRCSISDLQSMHPFFGSGWRYWSKSQRIHLSFRAEGLYSSPAHSVHSKRILCSLLIQSG